MGSTRSVLGNNIQLPFHRYMARIEIAVASHCPSSSSTKCSWNTWNLAMHRRQHNRAHSIHIWAWPLQTGPSHHADTTCSQPFAKDLYQERKPAPECKYQSRSTVTEPLTANGRLPCLESLIPTAVLVVYKAKIQVVPSPTNTHYCPSLRSLPILDGSLTALGHYGESDGVPIIAKGKFHPCGSLDGFSPDTVPSYAARDYQIYRLIYSR